jgi:hypothetical protein
LLYTLDGTTPQAAANGLKEVGRRVGPDGYTTELAGIPPGTVLAVTCTAVTVRLQKGQEIRSSPTIATAHVRCVRCFL